MIAMLALESDLDPNAVDASLAAPEELAPAPQPAETDAQFSTEGALPAVSETGTEVEPGMTASEQAFDDAVVGDASTLGAGMYEPGDYQAACLAAGTPDKWDDRYRQGHTDAKQWTQPYDSRFDMSFQLKPGESASQAVKDFIAGPTVADFRVICVATEMDGLRDQLGEQKFDRMFGSASGTEDAQIAPGQRLKLNIGMYGIPFKDQMLALAAQDDAVDHTTEPAAPEVAARVEDKPATVVSQPAPEMIAEELGMQRDQELA